MSNPINENHAVKEAREKFLAIISAYKALLASVDEFADSASLTNDWVLGKVMPSKAGQRRDTKRIENWFNSESQWIHRHIEEVESRRMKEVERENLINSLNLTPEQRKILFKQ